MIAIEVDGQLLVDANIQDTVVDTPVKNYTVLNEGTNGNLTNTGTQGSQYVTVFSADTFYFEIKYSGTANAGISTEYHSAGVANQDGVNFTVSGNGQIYRNGAAAAGGGAPFQFDSGDLIGCIVRPDAKTIDYYKNGTFVYTYTGLVGTSFATRSGHNAGSIVTATVNCGQQLFAGSNITHDLKARTVVINNSTYGTLNQLLAGYQVAGGYFYDEKNQRAVRGSDLIRRFGIDHADPRLGIYDLCEVPNYTVIGYEKAYDQYKKALRDYTPEVQVANAETEAAEAETAEVQALADKYLNYLRAAACMWMLDKVYEAGTIVEFNGQLYRQLLMQLQQLAQAQEMKPIAGKLLGISLS